MAAGGAGGSEQGCGDRCEHDAGGAERPVGDYPQEVLVTPDGKTAYVSCMHGAGTVSEIDLGSWKATRSIVTGSSTDGLAWAKSRE